MVRARPRHLAERMSLDSTEPYRRYVATDKARIRARCSPLAPSVRWLESTSRVLDERRADLDTPSATVIASRDQGPTPPLHAGSRLIGTEASENRSVTSPAWTPIPRRPEPSATTPRGRARAAGPTPAPRRSARGSSETRPSPRLVEPARRGPAPEPGPSSRSPSRRRRPDPRDRPRSRTWPAGGRPG